MNKILILRVKKFRLRLRETYATSDVHSWIYAALSHNIEELDISIIDFMFKLPEIFFNSTTLVVLKLNGKVELNVPEIASLPSLKVVHLLYLDYMCDADINRLLSASPVLQELLINTYYPRYTQRYNVISPSLKTLRIATWPWNNDPCRVVIDAPKLELLEFIDNGGHNIDIEIKNTPSIVKATLDLSGFFVVCKFRETGYKLSSLCSLCNIKVLSVTSFILKAAMSSEHDIRFNSLTKLVVDYCEDDLSILPQILKRLPSLQVLILNRLRYCNHTVKCEDWKHEKSEIHCLKYTLKTVDLGLFQGNEGEMSMLEYFLENGNVLNEVRASSKLQNKKESVKDIIQKKLLTDPRCLNAIKVIIS